MENWISCFPYPEFRDGQKEVIQEALDAFESGKKFVIIDAPTGAGKSAIGYTIGNFYKTYYYITAQKILQTQLSSDFGEDGKWSSSNVPMVELKGRNAYPCNYYERISKDPDELAKIISPDRKARFISNVDEDIDCAHGECKKMRKSKLKYCEWHCPYFVQLDKALANPAVLMNFHSFIFQTQYTNRWQNKELLIIDECHNTEDVLMDFVSIDFPDIAFNVEWPILDNPEEYLMWFEEHGIPDIITERLEQAIENNNDDEEEQWKHYAVKYNKFKTAMLDDDEIWLSNLEKIDAGRVKWNRLTLKPLYIKNFADELLFNISDRVLMMSATVLNPNIIADALGIDKKDMYSIKMPSTFPVKNRPIHYMPAGSMSYKNKHDTIPHLLESVIKLCNYHSKEKGIIHTHNFEIAELILNKAKEECMSDRFFYQNHFGNKEQMLLAHSASNCGIIIAPAMHEGLDLKNDLSRFQIICKVPYPSYMNNPQLKERMNISNDYYLYLTALKLVQSYGRSIRSEKDHARTYILDKDFKAFITRARSVLPEWFKDAIIW